MEDPRADLEGIPADMAREVVRRWLTGGTVVTGQSKGGGRVVYGAHGVQGAWMRLREEEAGGLLPFEDDVILVEGGDEEDPEEVVFGVDGEEKEVMPGGGRREYLYRGVRRLVVNSALEFAGLEVHHFAPFMMPGWPGEARRWGLPILSEMLDQERMAHFRLRWNAMDRLDTLFLDLRGFSLPRNGCLYGEDVARLARSLEGKGLSLLVIAGLRSRWRYPGPDPMKIEEVWEGMWDPEFELWALAVPEGGINWWRMFSGAVGPGGRLVFVDRKDADDLILQQEDPDLGAGWADGVA